MWNQSFSEPLLDVLLCYPHVIFIIYFYSLGKTVNKLLLKISPSKKDQVRPPSQTLDSGAILFFLLLSSLEAKLPCVMKFSYHGG